MPKLIDAVLALNVIMGPEGMTSMVDRINDRQEVVCSVPSTYPVMLGIVFESETDFQITIEVRHMGKALWRDSSAIVSPSNGHGERAFSIPVPVMNAGPSVITLRFNGQEVWTHRIFFAPAGSS
ncbi:MAG TPA: hypothetical protein VM846_04900 [Vicinamibacterales bacterium]|jgi:hypothetical protein|nr:hypothetical protein [Vicinamibacterales bacterium]